MYESWIDFMTDMGVEYRFELLAYKCHTFHVKLALSKQDFIYNFFLITIIKYITYST